MYNFDSKFYFHTHQPPVRIKKNIFAQKTKTNPTFLLYVKFNFAIRENKMKTVNLCLKNVLTNEKREKENLRSIKKCN